MRYFTRQIPQCDIYLPHTAIRIFMQVCILKPTYIDTYRHKYLYLYMYKIVQYTKPAYKMEYNLSATRAQSTGKTKNKN